MRMATVAHMSPSRPQRRDQETIPVMLDGVAVLVGVERTSTKGPGNDPSHAMMLGHGSINTTAQPQRRGWETIPVIASSELCQRPLTIKPQRRDRETIPVMSARPSSPPLCPSNLNEGTGKRSQSLRKIRRGNFNLQPQRRDWETIPVINSTHALASESVRPQRRDWETIPVIRAES